MQKGPLWWAGIIAQHHRHSDTPEDPHSPHVTSFWWSHVGWILSADHDETAWDAIHDFARYPELRWLDRCTGFPALCWPSAAYLIGGWSGLVVGLRGQHGHPAITRTFSINSLSHLFGKRRYATTDDSRNNFWLALITLGEGWHNNHHHYQSSANQGFFWWEIDISYYIIKAPGEVPASSGTCERRRRTSSFRPFLPK